MALGTTTERSVDTHLRSSTTSSPSDSPDGGSANMHCNVPHGRSCGGARSAGIWRGGTSPRVGRSLQDALCERQGKPYAGNPPVRFDEGPLACPSTYGRLGSTPPVR